MFWHGPLPVRFHLKGVVIDMTRRTRRIAYSLWWIALAGLLAGAYMSGFFGGYRYGGTQGGSGVQAG